MSAQLLKKWVRGNCEKYGCLCTKLYAQHERIQDIPIDVNEKRMGSDNGQLEESVLQNKHN